MKIVDLDKLKFTSIKYGGDIIHFKYDNEDYTLENGGTEMTLVTRLSKGRMKCHLEYISSMYGIISNLIIYKNNKRTLSSIDKENFIKKLVKYKLIEPTEEQQRLLILDEINQRLDIINKYNKEVLELSKKMTYLGDD